MLNAPVYVGDGKASMPWIYLNSFNNWNLLLWRPNVSALSNEDDKDYIDTPQNFLIKIKLFELWKNGWIIIITNNKNNAICDL